MRKSLIPAVAALALLAGPALAHAVERRLEYERRGVVWRRTT